MAGVLNPLRSILKKPNPPIGNDCMPLEFDYVDGCDFFADWLEDVTSILPTIQSTFKGFNLNSKPTKTEYVEYKLSETSAGWGKEKWIQGIM